MKVSCVASRVAVKVLGPQSCLNNHEVFAGWTASDTALAVEPIEAATDAA